MTVKKISNLHQNSQISLSSQVVQYDFEYIEWVLPDASMPPPLNLFHNRGIVPPPLRGTDIRRSGRYKNGVGD